MKIIKWFTPFHLLYLFSCYVMLLAAVVAVKLVFLPFGICFVHLWWKLPHKKYTHLHDFNRLCVHQYTFASLCLLPHCKNVSCLNKIIYLYKSTLCLYANNFKMKRVKAKKKKTNQNGKLVSQTIAKHEFRFFFRFQFPLLF